MTTPFDWRNCPSKLAASLKAMARNKTGERVTLRSTPHGGAYSRAVPLVTEQQVRDMDETGGIK